MSDELRLGTRGSQLALWQAHAVAARLQETGGPPCRIVVIRASGDRLQDAPLSEIGGKRLFVKEIEDALLRDEIDLAVHSSKDMPALLLDTLTIGAVLPREDPLDAIVLPAGQANLPAPGEAGPDELLRQAAAVLGPSPSFGTGSVRRIAQLLRLFPAARFTPIRGNLDTRLRKLDQGGHDAIVLASAGLRRLGMASRISVPLPPSVCVPAPGQGIVAIEMREEDDRVAAALRPIDDPATAAALRAERAVVEALGGGCQTPVGALATLVDPDLIELRAVVVSLDGARAIHGALRGKRDDAQAIGARVGAQLLADGAGAILAEAHDANTGQGDASVTPATVYLIGAGPGDSELITVKGLRYLQAADVVLYDSMVHARLLRQAKPSAEKIDVGKATPQATEQEAICYLLADKAREGKTVARLKWGDPFVFDFSGAEALFLHEHGVPFEVVPGIPAAIGAPSYAGIPVTYSGGGDTLTLVRGYEDESRTLTSVNWKHLAALDGTLVCYLGPRQAPTALRSLLTHGRAGGETAAIIYDGTLPTQETCVGSLEDLLRQTSASTDRRPALLVVGRVTALRDHLRWFDARPLFGKRVLVTRPREQAGELVARLEMMGAEAVEAPMIRIVPPDDYADLDRACTRITAFDWIIFSSVNAVDAFFDRLLATSRDLRALATVKLATVGPRTAGRLARHGLKADVVPSDYHAEALVAALRESGDVLGAKILLPRADIGREVVADGLRRAGANVTEVVAYRTIAAEPGRDGEPDIFRMLLDKRLDVVTFTSASAVHQFVQTVGAEPAADLLQTTVVASIGPATAEAAAGYHIRTTVLPAHYTVPSLVDAIVEHFERRPEPA